MQVLHLIIVIVSVICINIFSQTSPGAKQTSLSYSDVNVNNDVFAIFNNPAALQHLNNQQVGIYYSPSPFGIKELSSAYAAYNHPFSFGNIAVGFMNYGFELYSENKITAAYSFNLNERFSVGAALNLHFVNIKNYGSDNTFYLNAGGLLNITENIKWGFSIININNASFSEYNDQIPSVLSTGIGYTPIESLMLTGSLQKDDYRKLTASIGADYKLIEYLALRLSYSNNPSKISGGMGIFYSGLNFDYAFSNHPQLGISHSIGLIYSFNALP
ncbi:MAG: hypothetical protein ACM3O3_05715 [Syntrophothermus sp.]